MKYVVVLAAMMLFGQGIFAYQFVSLYDKVFSNYRGNYLIHVNKKDFQLKVVHRKLGIIKKYIISYGRNPDRKRKIHEGDERTPEGVYYISEILSSAAPQQSTAYKKLKRLNSIEFKASAGFSKCADPAKDQGKNIYGPRLYYLNYPNSEDKKRYKSALRQEKLNNGKDKLPAIGFGIAIHGTNEPESMGRNCSMGCIRLRNKDILSLDAYISLGMPVLIF